jgi:uncharacterized protein YcgI (DUF1989 family)
VAGGGVGVGGGVGGAGELIPAPESRTVIVPAGEGCAARVAGGSRFRVVDIEGGQVADLFAFADVGPTDSALADRALADPALAEWMSAEHTRPSIGRLFPAPGDEILSNRRRPLARLEEDRSPGWHDTLYAACDPARYELLGVVGPHRSCAGNLVEALEALETLGGGGAGETGGMAMVPQPFNLFMHVDVDPAGALRVQPASTAPGDSVSFRALVDLIVVVSSCPMDVVAIGRGGVTPLAIEVG